jgi:hypothetical protein
MKNDRIWQQVCKTDPRHTKEIGFGESAGKTSVNPQVRIKQATNIFGPVGIGWGYDIIEERFDNGAPMFSEGGEISGYELVHTIYLKLWYKDDDHTGEVKNYGHTPYMYVSSKGKIITDKEYAKKTLTDAIGKCLSMLGFNSDIYEGEFDNAGYIQEVAEEFEIAEAEDTAAKVVELREKYEAEVQKNIELIESATNKNEVEKLYRVATVRAKRKNDKPTIDLITKAAKKRAEELEEGKK